uniref:Protein disulfide isomerase family A, member 6 n=1 Tax=Callorhinchus milii TaxID=7868 RepID=A0A4W3I6W3_CALMI
YGAVACTFVLTVNALYSASDVIKLTSINFNVEVIQSDNMWLVLFYIPWNEHCQRMVQEWKKTATALKGIVKVGTIDVDKYGSMRCQYGIEKIPVIKIFAANKNMPEEYNGRKTSEAITSGILKSIQFLVKKRLKCGSRKKCTGSVNDMFALNDNNFDEHVECSDEIWMVEFYAPWCEHCKSQEPEWENAVSEVKRRTKGKVNLASVDITENNGLASQYGIQEVPIIKIFQKDQEPVDYDSEKSTSDIISKALDLYANMAPPKLIEQILNENIFKATCEDQLLCIISVLPDILDTGASGRNRYLNLMMKMADKYKKNQWGWLWTEPGAQPELEQSLGIGGFGYPAMAAMNAKKTKYVLLKDSFSDQGIDNFLRKLAIGRIIATPINGIFPKMNTVELWDGKDGELPVKDDLSDVDMDDAEPDD